MAGTSDQEPFEAQAAIGRRYECEPVVIDRDSVRAFARATGDANPLYTSAAPIAPPLYSARLFLPLIRACVRDPDLALDRPRLVHREQGLSWRGVLRAGDVVARQAVLDSVTQRRRGCRGQVGGRSGCHSGRRRSYGGTSSRWRAARLAE